MICWNNKKLHIDMDQQDDKTKQNKIKINKIFFQLQKMEQKKKNAQTLQPLDHQHFSMNIPSSSSFLSNINSNFFQVTINSNRLNKLFERIEYKLYLQNKKIQQLSDDQQVMEKKLNEKIDKQNIKYQQYYLNLEHKITENMSEKCAENCNIMNIVKQHEIKDQEISEKIEKLQEKVCQIDIHFQQQLKNGLVQIKQQIIGPIALPNHQHPKEDNNNEQIKQQLPATKKEIPKNHIDFNYLIKYFNEELVKNKKDIYQYIELLNNVKNAEKSKKYQKQYQQNIGYIKQHIQEHNISNEQLDAMNYKVLYPTKSNNPNNNHKTDSYVFTPMQKKQKKHSYNDNMYKNANKVRYMSEMQQNYQEKYYKMANKISYLQQMINNQSSTISQFINKQIVIDEKTILLTKKLQKTNTQQTQLKNSIRRIQAYKMDQRSIEQLKNNIKYALKDIQDKLLQKCSEQSMIRQKARVSQKISILHENLTEKANKQQVHKALVFLQNKIKQIVFLIASEQSDIREGAVTKVAPKCLSCDKELEKQVQNQVFVKNDNMNNKNNVLFPKAMNHRVRQKIKKQLSRVKTLGNFTSEDIQNDLKMIN